jgi:hypothetical protein
MKIILTTTTFVAVFTIALFGISNSGSNTVAYAAHHEGNDTSKPMNATLAYAAHHEGNDTKSMSNDTSMMMNATLIN